MILLLSGCPCCITTAPRPNGQGFDDDANIRNRINDVVYLHRLMWAYDSPESNSHRIQNPFYTKKCQNAKLNMGGVMWVKYTWITW